MTCAMFEREMTVGRLAGNERDCSQHDLTQLAEHLGVESFRSGPVCIVLEIARANSSKSHDVRPGLSYSVSTSLSYYLGIARFPSVFSRGQEAEQEKYMVCRE